MLFSGNGVVRQCKTTKMSLFRKSPKSPQEVSKALKDALTALERSDKKAEKVRLYTILVIIKLSVKTYVTYLLIYTLK